MDPSRARALEAARNMLGLTEPQLWLAYLGLGGNLLPATLSAALRGEVDLGDHDHDLLVQALNDRFVELDQDHPLPYADELPPAAE